MDINQTPLGRTPLAEDYFTIAKAAAEYLRKNSIKGDKGVYWMTAEDQKEGKKPLLDFYSGSAGIIFFFIELYDYTGETSYLEDAAAGGEYILDFLERNNWRYIGAGEFAQSKPYGKNEWSFYVGGVGGIAFAFIQLYRVTGDARYEEGARKLSEGIAGAAEETAGGLKWSGYSGINQDGGIILFLLYAAEYFKRPEWKETARRGALAIAATEVDGGNGQRRFEGITNPLKDFSGGLTGETFFPGFSYGVSGYGSVFARVYQETGDRALLEAAEKAAAYLISIATPVGEKGRLIPYWQPENPEGIHYLGFCHGPVGSSRIFVLLHRLTENKKYQDFYRALAKGITGSGAPEYHSAGYWDVHCMCCGTAGFVNHFLGLYLETGEDRYLDYALRSARVILGSASYNGNTAVWHQVFMRIWPDKISADLGYYHGSAGIASMLLRTAAILEGKFRVIRLPDEPYRASRGR
jgi:lantibiotic modifying enzyme